MRDHPRIPRSKFHVKRWFESLEQRQDPTGVAVDHVFYHVGSARLTLPYPPSTDPWGGSTVCSGNNLQYLGEDLQETGWTDWQAVTPCVAATHSLTGSKQVVLDVHAVVSQEHLDRVQQRMKCPVPGRMQALTRLIHLPKDQQQRFAQQLLNPDPTPGASSGRYPNVAA